ncbi:MAG: LTA synthase family protein, partial [Oscillospiraceae bacterium]|nr:LTA synthase family protein [Oscillospiraceae bacterium]
FFGDHQPNDYVVKPIYKEHGMDIENQSIEQQQKRQITPFFIWANYDIEEQTDVQISANYLCNLLMKVLGYELSPYQTYLETVAETFPVMNAVGYFDAEGNCRSYDDMTPEEQEVLDMYEKVQYYRMFDQ